MITTPTTVTRNWGEEITVTKTATHCGKLLRRRAGTKGGFQLHVKEESHYLHEGRMLLRTLRAGTVVETIVDAPASWTVPPLLVHQEEALTDCLVFEVGDPTVEDRYGIEPDPGGLKSMSDADAVRMLKGLEGAFRLRADDLRALAQHIWARGLGSFVEGRP